MNLEEFISKVPYYDENGKFLKGRARIPLEVDSVEIQILPKPKMEIDLNPVVAPKKRRFDFGQD